MRHLIITIFLFIGLSTAIKSQTIDSNFWDEKNINLGRGVNSTQPTSEPKVVNLGGRIENFPTTPEVKTEVKSKSREKNFNELWQEGLEKEKEKQQNKQSVRAYTYDELDKMGKINYKNPIENNSFYIYTLAFFILSFILYYCRYSIKRFLIIFLSNFFFTNSRNKELKKNDNKEILSLKDKLSALKDLENLYSTGVVNEAEFNRLKSEIFN